MTEEVSDEEIQMIMECIAAAGRWSIRPEMNAATEKELTKIAALSALTPILFEDENKAAQALLSLFYAAFQLGRRYPNIPPQWTLPTEETE